MSEKIHFCWLHLSDIHFGHGDNSEKWDQKLVLSKLIGDIASRNSKSLPNPDAIFVTGDIGNTGGCHPVNGSREYEDARQWLESLCDKAGVERKNVYIAPGNHDFQRNEADGRKIKRLLKELKDGNDNIDNALNDSEDKSALLSLFANFTNFASGFGPNEIEGRQKTFWNYTLKCEALSLTIVVLNTAFLATGDRDQGYLQLGRQQLSYILETSNSNEVVIVLSHHPFDWLADCKDVASWIMGNGHIHLFGHIHEASSESCRKGGGTSFIEIVSGAAHSDSKISGHGYSFGAIVSKGDALYVRVWPRRWSTPNKDFRTDVDNVPEGDVFIDHPLSVNVSLTENTATNIDESGIQVPVKFIRNSDPIPALNVWVGRDRELKQFLDDNIKVFAITGIGGQGKSFLATKFIELLPQGTFWDWRDCREESDTFQTQILNVIERITNGQVSPYVFRESKINDIIEHFFKLIEDFEGVFVFDNVDHYIDVESNKATSGVGILIDLALKRRHKSTFVFTSRPAVVYNDTSFFQITLHGLGITETEQLFSMRGILVEDIKTREAIATIREHTKGHPMWLNVIASQIAKNGKNLEAVIKELEEGVSDDLDITMLRSVWKTLNPNQKLVLRCMAETVRPETHDRISDYLANKLKWNRVSRAMNTLKSLNLIVVKKSPDAKDTFELHPIVKAYVRKEFYKSERVVIIDMISSFYDRYIKTNSKKVKECASLSVLENWTLRAELAINAGKYKDALTALDEVTTPLLSNGYAEEFIRVTGKLLYNLDFEDAIYRELSSFDTVFENCVKAMIHLGKDKEVEGICNKYESAIGKTARYVNLCNIRCYFYWWRGQYDTAKRWGRTGIDIKRISKIDTHFDCSDHLALAQRDSGEVDEALTHFLGGSELEDVLDINELSADKGGEFYGNIGRCLFLRNCIPDALVCYKKSLKLLERKNTELTGVNLGWGYYWIGEALEQIGQLATARSFYCKASRIWEVHSPTKVDKAIVACQKIDGEIADAKDLDFELTCNKFLWG